MIFNDSLNAAQIVIAVLIYRFVDSERKRRSGEVDAPRFLAYANHFLAMILGEYLLQERKISVIGSLNHQN